MAAASGIESQSPIFPAELARTELSYPTWWLSSLKCVENGLSLKSANFRLLSLPPCLSASDLTLTAMGLFFPWIHSMVAPWAVPKDFTYLLFLIEISKMIHHFDLCWREGLFRKERIKDKSMGSWTKEDVGKGSSSKTSASMMQKKGPMSGKQRSF